MPNACIGFYIMDAKLPFLDFNNDLTLCMSLFGISKSLDNLIQGIAPVDNRLYFPSLNEFPNEVEIFIA